MEKIAVRCKTEDEWDKVVFRIGLNKSGYLWTETCHQTCIATDKSGYGSIAIQEEEGYRVISAAEYLEGEVEEFKVGDRVECTNRLDSGIFGKTYTVDYIEDGALALEELSGTYGMSFFKLVTTNKPKSKENNIMLDLNSTIRTVLVDEDKSNFDIVEKVQKQFGGEITENFTGLINFRRDKQLYIAEIDRLEKEAIKAAKEAAKK